jgi:DNA (cytosine-5)-methyltransferase 1
VNFYNEHDPKAAAWLRELIKHEHIPAGIVDERSIEDIRPSELDGFTQCHFFAGIGGWSLALRLAGWPENRPVWTGSCPCQPFSSAGKGGGFADERHLWPAFYHIISSQRTPPVVFGEQVASVTALAWLDLVRDDMERAGYAFGAADLCAASVGARHIRQRIWWVANPIGERGCSGKLEREHAVDADARSQASGSDWLRCGETVEPCPAPLVDGFPGRLGLLRPYGNAIVPQVAAQFIRAYCETMTP